MRQGARSARSPISLGESGPNLLEENYFDALWRPVISHRKDTGSGKERFVVKSYDVDGHMLFESYLTYPDSARPAQSPNAFGEQGSAGGHATAVTRYANGALAGYTFGNGIVRQIGLNGRYLPSSITDTNPGVGTVYQVSLTYDANANVATLNDYLATTDTTAGTHNRTMGYDDLDRLTSASSPAEWGAATYDYDPLDNLRTRTRTGQVVSTGYGGANRINGFSVNGAGQPLTQDAKGNITQRGNLVMNWDAENRLTSVTGPTSQSYEYDGNGRRALVHNADGSSLVQVYSQKGLLLAAQKLNASGAVTQNTKTFFLDGKPIVEINGSTASYLHTDALGSPVLRTNSSRAGTADTAYDPWGDTWTGNEPSTFGYTGHVNDTATGLVYMQQRYYDPLIDRFLSTDPEPVNSNNGSNFNRYWYANNNPYRYTDPDGRAPKNLDDSANGIGPARAGGGSVTGGTFSGIPKTASAGAAAAAPEAAAAANAPMAATRGAAALPDSAMVCRGGACTAENFSNGSGVTTSPNGALSGVSTQSAPNASLDVLAKPFKNNQVGVTTAGSIREAGGQVVADGTAKNPNHATVNNLTPQQLEKLFTPTVTNPVPRDQRGL